MNRNAQFFWYHPRLHGLILEARSFVRRLRCILQSDYRPECRLGAAHLNRNLSDFLQRRGKEEPWLSPADRNLIADGWKAAKWDSVATWCNLDPATMKPKGEVD